MGSISALGDPEALGRAQAVQDDGSLTPKQRQQGLADLESGAWESKVLGNISAFGGEEALGRAQAVLNDGSLTREQRWEALAGLESETWEAKVLGNIRALGDPEALTRAQAVQNDGSLTPEQRQKALADLESETWEYIKQHNEEAAVKNRDLAESLGWDPDARGGRPELTPWEYIEQRNERAEREARDLAASLGWDPDARGGRPELTPWEYIDQHNAEVALGNVRALGDPEILARAQAVQDDGSLTPEQRQQALPGLEAKSIEQATSNYHRAMADYQAKADLWEAEQGMGAPERSIQTILDAEAKAATPYETEWLEHQEGLGNYYEALADYQARVGIWEAEQEMGATERAQSQSTFADTFVPHGPLTPTDHRAKELRDRDFFTGLTAEDLRDPRVMDIVVYIDGQPGTLGDVLSRSVNLNPGGRTPIQREHARERAVERGFEMLASYYANGQLSLYPAGVDGPIAPALFESALQARAYRESSRSGWHPLSVIGHLVPSMEQGWGIRGTHDWLTEQHMKGVPGFPKTQDQLTDMMLKAGWEPNTVAQIVNPLAAEGGVVTASPDPLTFDKFTPEANLNLAFALTGGGAPLLKGAQKMGSLAWRNPWARETATSGLTSGGLSGGLHVVLPDGSDGWFDFSSGDIGRFGQGFAVGTGTGMFAGGAGPRLPSSRRPVHPLASPSSAYGKRSGGRRTSRHRLCLTPGPGGNWYYRERGAQHPDQHGSNPCLRLDSRRVQAGGGCPWRQPLAPLHRRFWHPAASGRYVFQL